MKYSKYYPMDIAFGVGTPIYSDTEVGYNYAIHGLDVSVVIIEFLQLEFENCYWLFDSEDADMILVSKETHEGLLHFFGWETYLSFGFFDHRFSLTGHSYLIRILQKMIEAFEIQDRLDIMRCTRERSLEAHDQRSGGEFDLLGTPSGWQGSIPINIIPRSILDLSGCCDPYTYPANEIENFMDEFSMDKSSYDAGEVSESEDFRTWVLENNPREWEQPE